MQLIPASHGPLAEAFLQSAELITGMRPSMFVFVSFWFFLFFIF